MNTIILAIIGVMLVLWIYFKSIKIAIISSIPTIFTLIWLAGTMHLMDIRITVMTASIGAMMIGLSVDYAIHLTHRYHKEIKDGRENALKSTVVGVGSALFASVITTMAGFLAMLLGVSPNSQTQGFVLAIGVKFCCSAINVSTAYPIVSIENNSSSSVSFAMENCNSHLD